VMIGLWLGLVAPGTVSYLAPALRSVVKPLEALLLGRHHFHAASGVGGPWIDRWLGYGSVLVVLIGLVAGWWRVWHHGRGNRWALALSAGAASYGVLLVARLVSSDAASLAGRAFTYVYLPVGFVIAMAIVDPVSGSVRPLLGNSADRTRAVPAWIATR
ncbi:MAG: hypothetical protein ACRD0J_14015, partial [Acidimicrobiales bacterium]